MSALDRILGNWEFTMHHFAMTEPITGRQRYEPVLDGAFVLMRWTYDHPDFPNAMALISTDTYHYFDVRGITRIFELDLNDDGWSMIHPDPNFAQRSIMRFQGPDLMESTGELSNDNGATWQADASTTARRIKSAADGS